MTNVRRALWKGRLCFGDIRFGVGLYSALSSEEKISFHIVNRKTGHRVERKFVDSETEHVVDKEQRVRGYELDDGDYVLVEDEALKALMPDSDKTLTVRTFIACDDVDKLYFDKPYYLAPSDEADAEGFALFAEALAATQSTALADAVLFRRNRSVLIRPHGNALIATTLNYDYEVRSARNAFKSLQKHDFDRELLDLAGHIIDTKMGKFDPSDYRDRYNDALAELVQAKMSGKPLPKHKRAPERKVIDLREALRLSAKGGATGKPGSKRQKSGAETERKAG